MNTKPYAEVPAVEVVDALMLTLGGALKMAQLVAESMEDDSDPTVFPAFTSNVVFPLMHAVNFLAEANDRSTD